MYFLFLSPLNYQVDEFANRFVLEFLSSFLLEVDVNVKVM